MMKKCSWPGYCKIAGINDEARKYTLGLAMYILYAAHSILSYNFAICRNFHLIVTFFRSAFHFSAVLNATPSSNSKINFHSFFFLFVFNFILMIQHEIDPFLDIISYLPNNMLTIGTLLCKPSLTRSNNIKLLYIFLSSICKAQINRQPSSPVI